MLANFIIDEKWYAKPFLVKLVGYTRKVQLVLLSVNVIDVDTNLGLFGNFNVFYWNSLNTPRSCQNAVWTWNDETWIDLVTTTISLYLFLKNSKVTQQDKNDNAIADSVTLWTSEGKNHVCDSKNNWNTTQIYTQSVRTISKNTSNMPIRQCV